MKPSGYVHGFVAIAATVGLGLVLGSIFFTPPDGPRERGGHTAVATLPESAPPASGSPYPVNADGLTYGSSLGIKDGTGPDLIAAIGTNGQTGYVRADDLDEPAPESTKQALQANSVGARHIPLYAVDGSTVIGQFVIAPPTDVRQTR